MSETPEKKKARLRYDNVFKTAWTDEVHFIKHSQKGNKFAFCEFCRTDFSINHGGHSDVTKHVGTAKHKGNAKDVQSSRSLAMFLPGSSKSSTDNITQSVINAETLVEGFIIEHNLPLTINDHFTRLTRHMFHFFMVLSYYI